MWNRWSIMKFLPIPITTDYIERKKGYIIARWWCKKHILLHKGADRLSVNSKFYSCQSCKDLGTYKVRNEIETKRNETKRNQRKRNETKRNQRKRNETKRNETKSTKWKRNKTKPTKAKRNQRKQNEIENGRKNNRSLKEIKC
jgi:hypothetical protein